MYLNSDQMGSDSLAHLACAEHGRSEAFQAYVVPHSGPRSRLGEEIEQPSEVLSAPDGTTLTTPIADSQASKAPKQNPTSQPQLATRKENNIMDPLFKNIPESSFDGYHHGVCTPSTLEEDSSEDEDSQELCREEIERFFGRQADDTLCGNA